MIAARIVAYTSLALGTPPLTAAPAPSPLARNAASTTSTAAATVRLRALPQLDDPVPAKILKSHAAHRTCDAGDHHRDPCASIRILHDRVTIAWDAKTHLVTYLYSTTLVTDSELGAGGSARLDSSYTLIPLHTAFVSTQWCDTDSDISGDALWCAILKPDTAPRYGKIVGFVQSVYIPIPDSDPPLQRTSQLGPAPLHLPSPAIR